MARGRTITKTGERRRAHDAAKPFLTILLQCDRPLQPGARFCIGDTEAVSIGRADALCAKLESDVLEIGIPDQRVSSAHLRLECVLGAWMAEDAGSKNGTLIGGRRITRERLSDGEILELGNTFLLFRAALRAHNTPTLLDGRDLRPEADGLATLSPAFASELERLRAVAASPVPVLLRGESGAGKEVLAAAVHRLSGRRGPFQPVNCGAIPPNLIESNLFGHRRGAFSGAVDDQPGLVRGAHRGTLLLDEIGDLPLPAQAALLRVLQEDEVLPVGAARPVKVDLRVVAATHQDLDALVAERRFRPDLLARLSGYVCQVPPLRERREDFSLIVAALLAKLGATDATFSADAARLLLSYEWPLNVRELEKCLASAVALARGERITSEHLPASVSAAPAAPAPDQRRRDELITQLRAHRGNVSAVARAMGKARAQVQRWLRRFRIDPFAFRR